MKSKASADRSGAGKRICGGAPQVAKRPGIRIGFGGQKEALSLGLATWYQPLPILKGKIRVDAVQKVPRPFSH